MSSPGPFTVSLICDLLVDQNRYIGSDPVGYKCSQPAAFKMGTGHLICRKRAYILVEDPLRITFPEACFGEEFQLEQIQFFLETALSRRK